MRKAFFICIIISLTSVLSSAQSVKVSDPRPELRGNTLYIQYDIIGCEPSDEFVVSLIVTDENGQEVSARTLSGDVGALVYGGGNKEIRWDLTADQIEMEAQIFFKVQVKRIPPPEPVVVIPPPVEEDKEGAVQEDPLKDDTRKNLAEEPARQETTQPENHGSKEFSRAGIVAQSLAVPGLGLYRLTGKPHWLRAVAGYGCIAGSVILNRKAISTYNEIPGVEDPGEKENLFQSSLSQDQTSEILAYTAIAIWVSDLVWTLAGTSDFNKMTGHDLSLISAIDPVSSVPLFGLKLKF